MVVKSPLDVYYYCYEKGNVTSIPKDWNITKNFTWNEAFCNELPTDGVPFYDVFQRIQKSAQEFQKVRDHINRPMNIHCWYRSVEHNVRAYIQSGFSKTQARTKTRLSVHLYASAIDFSIAGLTDAQIRSLLVAGVNAGKYKVRIEDGTNGWCHIDTGCPFITGGYNYGLFKI